MWFGLHEPHEDEFAAVAAEFELHPLAVEDAVHAHQRAKLETYGSTLFIVLKAARYVDPEEIVSLTELMPELGWALGYPFAVGLMLVRRAVRHVPPAGLALSQAPHGA